MQPRGGMFLDDIAQPGRGFDPLALPLGSAVTAKSRIDRYLASAFPANFFLVAMAIRLPLEI
jgi:hypothetical protein